MCPGAIHHGYFSEPRRKAATSAPATFPERSRTKHPLGLDSINTVSNACPAGTLPNATACGTTDSWPGQLKSGGVPSRVERSSSSMSECS